MTGNRRFDFPRPSLTKFTIQFTSNITAIFFADVATTALLFGPWSGAHRLEEGSKWILSSKFIYKWYISIILFIFYMIAANDAINTI